MKCNHDPYWIGNYGTCMACRAEKAEAVIKRLAAELVRLTSDPEAPQLVAEGFHFTEAAEAGGGKP